MDIIYSKNHNENFIEDILYIDSEVYPKEMCGNFDSVNARFEKNKDSYILLYDEKKLVGYMCFFPVVEKLGDEILDSDMVFDDNITPDEICEYKDGVTLFLISIAILPKYQNGNGIILLTNAFYEFIKEKNSNNAFIKRIIALAVSEGGSKLLKRMNFKKYKQIKDEYELFLLKNE